MKAVIPKIKVRGLLAVVGLLTCLVMAMTAGCGLETEKANQYLKEATRHQEEAEAILLRFKAFPNDWETIFNVYGISAVQVAGARQLVQAREQDLDALMNALKAWRADLRKISKLYVDMKVKEYVSLKTKAINLWLDYAEDSLRPLIKVYGGMIDIIERGGSAAEQEAKAQDIMGLVSESAQKLEEYRAAEKQAEDYFSKNKLGK
jgi:hypothetical protein